MSARRVGVPILLAVSMTLASPTSTTLAQTTDARCIEELTDAEVDARYRTIYRALAEEERHGKWWYFGWLAIFTSLATAQGVLAGLDVGGQRPRYMAGTIGTGLSVFAYTVFPRFGDETAFAPRRLRRAPASTPEERRARLHLAEKTLERNAGRQQQNTAALAHVQGYAFGLVSSLTLGLGYGDTFGAIQFALASPAINTTRVLTAPTGAIRAWEGYQNATKTCLAPTLRQRPTWHWGASLGHVTLALRWP
jgi:hypothetical protein